jgi:hypothetical protein
VLTAAPHRVQRKCAVPWPAHAPSSPCRSRSAAARTAVSRSQLCWRLRGKTASAPGDNKASFSVALLLCALAATLPSTAQQSDSSHLVASPETRLRQPPVSAALPSHPLRPCLYFAWTALSAMLGVPDLNRVRHRGGAFCDHSSVAWPPLKVPLSPYHPSPRAMDTAKRAADRQLHPEDVETAAGAGADVEAPCSDVKPAIQPSDVHVLLADDEKISRLVTSKLLRMCVSFRVASPTVRPCVGLRVAPTSAPVWPPSPMCSPGPPRGALTRDAACTH